MRDRGLGWIVIVVGDEIMNRVLGEEFAIFLGELGRERLVVREHQGGLIELRDDIRDREGLSRPRNPEQSLVSKSLLKTFRQRGNRRRLIARRLEGQMELEVSHSMRLRTVLDLLRLGLRGWLWGRRQRAVR